MRVAVTLGVSLLLVARALVRRGASVHNAAAHAMTAAMPMNATAPTEAVVLYLDAYRRRRADTGGFHRESHSAS